ncbi:MAG TPA: hypothetical protein VGH81_04485 [Rudaea sp.]
MDFRRSRRSAQLMAGPTANFGEHRTGAPAGWAAGRMLSARQRFFRGSSRSSGAGSGDDRPASCSTPSRPKRQTSAFSLLVATVLALWLVLFVFGHR